MSIENALLRRRLAEPLSKYGTRGNESSIMCQFSKLKAKMKKIKKIIDDDNDNDNNP